MARTILLISHRPRAARRARALLENSGYRVEVARDGSSGAEAFERLRPDLTLVGDAEPATQGAKVCQRLKSSKRGRNAPVLWMGARRAAKRGKSVCDGYLVTPVSDEELLRAVRRGLSNGSNGSGGGRLEPDVSPAPASRSVSGDLEHLNVAEIVQTLSLGTKTACVTLVSAGRRGQIWFDAGAARHASTDGIEGEEAFCEMIRWRSGEFSIGYGASCESRTIDQDTMYLVMEGLRRVDEAADPGIDRQEAVAEKDGSDGPATEEASPAPTPEYAPVLLTPRMREELAEAVAAVARPSVEDRRPAGRAVRDAADPERPGAAVAPLDARRAPAATNRSRGWIWAIPIACVVLLAFGIQATMQRLAPTADTQTPPPAHDTASDRIVEEPAPAGGPDETWLFGLAALPEPAPAPFPIGEEIPQGPPPEEAPLVEPMMNDATQGQEADAPSVGEPVGPVDAPAESGFLDTAAETSTGQGGEEGTAEPSAAIEVEDTAVETSAGPQVDYTASLAAANEILAAMTDSPPLTFEPAHLDLAVTSSVKAGTLTLLVDDTEVFSSVLGSTERGRVRESFDTRVAVEFGEHTVVARLELDDESYSYENSVVVELEPGESVQLELVAGKSRRRPVLLTVR